MTVSTMSLPTETDAVGSALSRAVETIELVTLHLTELSEFDSGGAGCLEFPEVTAEHVSALATIRDDPRLHLGELNELAGSIDRGLSQAIGLGPVMADDFDDRVDALRARLARQGRTAEGRLADAEQAAADGFPGYARLSLELARVAHAENVRAWELFLDDHPELEEGGDGDAA